MQLEIVSYTDLLAAKQETTNRLEKALLEVGIVGVSNVPMFAAKSRAYVDAARRFTALAENVKEHYAPNRDSGVTEGYELGAEYFKNAQGEWQIDDKKASYYAYVPEDARNVWPTEVDLKTPYLELGELIFKTGKCVLDVLQLNKSVGLNPDGLRGYGRMLHYHKAGAETDANPDWCGGHYDHGLFTGLMPAYYFKDGQEVSEPAEAGLYIIPTKGEEFEKVNVPDQSIMLFQVGECGQLISNDRICATKHIVKKAMGQIERYAFALFYTPPDEYVMQSRSVLVEDARYQEHLRTDGGVIYRDWGNASFARYRAS